MTRLSASIVAIAAIAIGASLACVPLMGLMFLMPFFAGIQRSRIGAYCVAFTYFAGASWALVPAARNFFGAAPFPAASVVLWLVSSALLAAPWALIWTARQNQLAWRIPLGLLAAVLPPLGIIGWASPLTSAGILFPATGWCGLMATAALPGFLVLRPRVALPGAVVSIVFSNLAFTGIPAPPVGWEAVDTHFGGIAHGATSAVTEFAAAESIQEDARASTAHVIIFPETVVPMWTEATDLFWQQTLAELRASGKTISLGAGRPVPVIAQSRPLPEQVSATPSYPQYSNIFIAESGANSEYHSLQASLNRRLARGLTVIAAYTFSKSIDDTSAFLGTSGDKNFPQNSHNLRAEHALSSFDTTHRGVLAYVYRLPFRSVVLRSLESAAIVTVQSGQPFTPTLQFDNSNTGNTGGTFGSDRPNVVGNPAISHPSAGMWFNPAAFAVPAQYTFGTAGRNILRGPGLATVDLSMSRRFKVAEHAELSAEAQAFNLFNRENLNLPSAFADNPATFGRIFSSHPPRQVQLALRLSF